MHGIREAAQLAGISEDLLELWLERGMVKPTQEWASAKVQIRGLAEDVLAVSRYRFDDDAVEQIRQLAEASNATSDVSPSRRIHRNSSKSSADTAFHTVAQIATMWNLSPDTIRRWFADEPGVITMGDDHPRGKRRRVTLRIPKEVLERVKRKRAKR